MTQKTPFEKWWYEEGSQAPYTHHDCEEHTKRMCEIAWAKSEAKEREACAKVCDDWESDEAFVNNIADAIRARGER
jgi:hypothetical protein